MSVIRWMIRPSNGTFDIVGRVVGLNLGLGFQNALTGYDNLYAGGALMGLRRREVEERIPEILNFAELEDVLSDPVRTYSSGMRLRLAFALATIERPDILLIDEALSVGDAYFQQKCMHRIRTFQAEGSTLLLVSHDPAAVNTLCDRATLLADGLAIREGGPREVLEYYNAWLAERTQSHNIVQHRHDGGRNASTRSGNQRARIEDVRLLAGGAPRDQFIIGEELRIELEASAVEELEDLTVGISIRDRLGNEVFGTNTHLLGISAPPVLPGARFVASFCLPVNLGPGDYSMTAALHAGRVHVQNSYDWWDNVCVFKVLPAGAPTFQGTTYLPVVASIDPV